MSAITATTTTAHDDNACTSGPIVYVTGFGPFANIKVNPSSTVAQKVAAGLERRGDLAAVHVTELETSIVAVTEHFDSLEKSIAAQLAANPRQKFLLFHVGVHSGEKNGVMRVETMGYNELHASVPDVRGVAFNHDPIIADDGPTETRLVSFFGQGVEHDSGSDAAAAAGAENLKRLNAIIDKINAQTERREAVKRKKGVHGEPEPAPTAGAVPPAHLTMPEFQVSHWTVSTNAGRYLCNCALYRALRIQQKYRDNNSEEEDAEDGSTNRVPSVCAVFIHVCDPKQGTEKASTTTAALVVINTAGDNPQAAGQTAGMAVDKYNPSIMEQSQQTETVAHELLGWIKAA